MFSESRRSDGTRFPTDTRNLAPSLPYGERPSPTSVQSPQAWGEGLDFHLYRLGTSQPTMPRTPQFVAAPSAFKPLKTTEDSGISMKSATNTAPRMAALDYRMYSPTFSNDTKTTFDTLESISSLDSPPKTSSLKGFMPVWIPPRDDFVCRVLEKSFDAVHRRSPMSDQSSKKSTRSAREEDPVRRSRLKTEMCMHFENGSNCPFGTNCTYAHGEEELQMTKLVDLHRAGLVDMDTYRIKPCLTWISTGSWYVTTLEKKLAQMLTNQMSQKIESSD